MSTTTRSADWHRRPLRHMLHDLAALYRTARMHRVLLAVLLITTLVSAATYSIDRAPLPAAIGTLCLCALAHVAMRYPSTAATTTVVGVVSVLGAPLAPVYAWAAASAPDVASTVLTFVAVNALTGFLAHRLSHTKAWATTLAITLSYVTVGPILVFIYPTPGFLWAWALLAVGLTLSRVRFADRWARHLARRNLNRLALSSHQDTPDSKTHAATSRLLTALPDPYQVFDDYADADGGLRRHLVVGPTGAFLISTLTLTGAVRHDPVHGLVHRRANVPALLHEAAEATRHAARNLKIKRGTLEAVAVAHTADLPEPCSRVEIATGENRLAQVSIVTPAYLCDMITSGETDWNSARQRQVIERILRARARAKN
jgi:hypothetical protein